MATNRETWLKNLKEILIGCGKDDTHPVTFYMDGPGQGYLSIQDKPLIKEMVTVEDVFECFGIKEG